MLMNVLRTLCCALSDVLIPMVHMNVSARLVMCSEKTRECAEVSAIIDHPYFFSMKKQETR